ncbi:potassium-transporting ATPase subunit KdpA [Microlunatus panaciterrae]|uniref:Potassium-transporting ATPase potassium-binding subunit n=1 Tax=Microlunatus panaciterrae TaxID=400768 RepID=A0ABS2RK79_9ACTN|nr:potassium-transporting ATPase subunit KdpA [Microlunatus panaciterrae]MBM7798571.1 K+-transporting ATPase ATPase A chain [Microlunatus panaciterrae]
MTATVAGVLQIALLVLLLGVAYVPLGDYMARVFTSERHLAAERVLYRVVRVDPDADQRWYNYLLSLLGFSAASVVCLYGLLRLQRFLPLSLGHRGLEPTLAWNTAVSFVTNTNWQSYSGEASLGYLAQMAGLTVQNFASAAVGLCAAMALIRGLASEGGGVGNFWTDLTRGIVRILLPLAVIFGLALAAGGVIQNLAGVREITTLTGGTQQLPAGPVASQEVIKQLGTNGGGFFNANSSHPFENPNAVTNLLAIFLELLIPVCLTRTFGRMVGRMRQGYAALGFVSVLWLGSLIALWAMEASHRGTALQLAGAAMEGKETRFGIPSSVLFATSTTATSSGAVDSMHSSFTGLGGAVLMLNMMLGEVSPGGVGSGLFGLVVLAILTVFLAGLMVGRTPEFLGKRVRRAEITYVALYCLAMPAVLLVGVAVAAVTPMGRDSRLNPGPHGLSEMLYAFTSAANNNGSAFAGLGADTPFYNVGLGIVMLIGRFGLIALVLALAGSLAQQQRRAENAGTLPTQTPLFVGLHVGTALIVTALTFFPALALGPIAEGLS